MQEQAEARREQEAPHAVGEVAGERGGLGAPLVVAGEERRAELHVVHVREDGERQQRRHDHGQRNPALLLPSQNHQDGEQQAEGDAGEQQRRRERPGAGEPRFLLRADKLREAEEKRREEHQLPELGALPAQVEPERRAVQGGEHEAVAHRDARRVEARERVQQPGEDRAERDVPEVEGEERRIGAGARDVAPGRHFGPQRRQRHERVHHAVLRVIAPGELVLREVLAGLEEPGGELGRHGKLAAQREAARLLAPRRGIAVQELPRHPGEIEQRDRGGEEDGRPHA